MQFVKKKKKKKNSIKEIFNYINFIQGSKPTTKYYI